MSSHGDEPRESADTVTIGEEAPAGRLAFLPPLLGGALGSVGGAVAGLLVGGPLGFAAGALLGGAAGAPAGDIVGAERRPLTPEEREAARLVFGDSLDLDRVRVAGAPVLGIGRMARALPGAIFFPLADFRAGLGMAWLIHELTHAWQYQQGMRVHTLLHHALKGRRAYDYGGEAGLRKALAAGKRFTGFNTEQQGDILRDYYRRITDPNRPDVSAWEPFVAEVRRTRPRR